MTLRAHYSEYLSFLHLDLEKEKWSENFIACKNESTLPSTNRVFIPSKITENDVQQLKQFYGDTPFTLWINKNNLQGNENAQELKFEKRASYPLMLANAQDIFYQENPMIKVERVTLKDVIVNFLG